MKVLDSSSSQQTVREVNDNSWSETALTYKNRPAPLTQLALINGGKKYTFIEIDLTNAVSAQAGNLFSLAIVSSGSDGLDLASKESSSDQPGLEIIYL